LLQLPAPAAPPPRTFAVFAHNVGMLPRVNDSQGSYARPSNIDNPWCTEICLQVLGQHIQSTMAENPDAPSTNKAFVPLGKSSLPQALCVPGAVP